MTQLHHAQGGAVRHSSLPVGRKRVHPRIGGVHFFIASVLVGAIGFRILEFVPALALVKPILLITCIAVVTFVVSTGGAALFSPVSINPSRWLLGFFAWMLVCVPTSVWVGASVDVVRGMLITCLSAWLLLGFPKEAATSDRLQVGFVWSAAIFSLLVAIRGGEMFEGRYGAAIGLDVNDIGLVVVTSIPLALGLALRSPKVMSAIYWLVVLLMTATVMRTGSRGAGLALLALAVVFLVGLPWRRSFQLAMLGLPIVMGAWVTAPESFRERMKALVEGEEDYNQTSADGRLAIWERGISYGIAHPVFGVGPGGFITQDGIGKAERGLQGKWSAAHNTYVQVFAEMGVPGLVLFVGLIGSVFRLGWRAHRGRAGEPSSRRPEYLASLVAYMVAATFLSFLFYHMTWLLLAALATMAAGAVRRPGASSEIPPIPHAFGPRRRLRTPPRAQPAPVAAGYAFGRNSAR